jgi:hypothetical protein
MPKRGKSQPVTLKKSWTKGGQKLVKRWSKGGQKVDKIATSSQLQISKCKMQNVELLLLCCRTKDRKRLLRKRRPSELRRYAPRNDKLAAYG